MTTAPLPPEPPPPSVPPFQRRMTDLRAIEIAIHVMQATTAFAGLVAELTGANERERDARVDEITAALFRLQRIEHDLREEGVHCIEG